MSKGQWRACSTCNYQLQSAAKSPDPSSPSWKGVKLQIVFLTKDQPMPANLIRILLLRAGIHPNPGPIPGSNIYNCPICQKRVYEHTKSVRCSSCLQWCHLRQKNNCSQLKSYNQYQPNYKCQICRGLLQTSQPVPAPVPDPIPVPVHQPATQPSQPVFQNQSRLTRPMPTPPNTPPPGQPANQPEVLPSKKYNLKVLQLNCNCIKGMQDI